MLCLWYIFTEHQMIEGKINAVIQNKTTQQIINVWKTKFWNIFVENIQKAREGGPTIIEKPHENPFNFSW